MIVVMDTIIMMITLQAAGNINVESAVHIIAINSVINLEIKNVCIAKSIMIARISVING